MRKLGNPFPLHNTRHVSTHSFVIPANTQALVYRPIYIPDLRLPSGLHVTKCRKESPVQHEHGAPPTSARADARGPHRGYPRQLDNTPRASVLPNLNPHRRLHRPTCPVCQAPVLGAKSFKTTPMLVDSTDDGMHWSKPYELMHNSVRLVGLTVTLLPTGGGG